MGRREALIDQLTGLRSWVRGGERAPHKPLLLLLALARVQRGDGRLTSFGEIEPKLRELLRVYGPPRRAVHPEYPYWRLQSDGLWEVALTPGTRRPPLNSDLSLSLLRKTAIGGFPESLDSELRADPGLICEAGRTLLFRNFPESVHDEIACSVGLSLDASDDGRDPEFRRRILRAYEYRCAVCGYDGRLDDISVGVEAAHIRWHSANGSATVDNGMALCSLHHKALDLGAIGLDETLRIIVSSQVNGGKTVTESILRYSGKPLVGPQRGEQKPAILNIRWHLQNVFRGQPRPAMTKSRPI